MSDQNAAQAERAPRRSDLRHRHGTRFWALVAAASLIAAILLVLGVEATVSAGKIHPGVSISGLNVGGLTENEATTTLAKYVASAQTSPITLTSNGKSWSVMPADLGAQMDVTGAVAAAMNLTRRSNVFADLVQRWALYFDSRDLVLEGSIDSAKMDTLLAEIATELDVEPVDANLTVKGREIKVIEGQDGRAVDREVLGNQLEMALCSLRPAQIAVPLVVKQPEVTAEDHQTTLDQAQTMISAPVTLTNGDDSWVLTPDEIVRCVEFSSEIRNGAATLVPVLSATKLSSFYAQIASKVAKEPVDASFASDGNKAWVVPAEPGQKFDPARTTEALKEAALRTTGRTAEVVVMESQPSFTTAEAETMGISDKLASYETEPYYGSSNRQVNVRITTEYAENVFLAPGEEYDFDKRVGPRTPERGYKLAPGIVGDGIMKNVYGGGICQVSTTLFNTVLEAGLEILERHNHTLYISHYPDGRDATVAGQGRNFRFRNDTDHYVWIRGRSDGVHTRFTIYGTDDGRQVKIAFSGFSYGAARAEETVVNPSLGPGESHLVRSGQQGRSCSVTRTVTMPDGTVLHNGPEIFRSYHPMISMLTEVGPSKTTTTSPPPADTTTTTSTTSHSTTSTAPPTTADVTPSTAF